MVIIQTLIIHINFWIFDFRMKNYSIYLQILKTFAIGVHMGCYRFMQYMSRATYNETGSLVDPGSDLNISDGIAEWVPPYLLRWRHL